MVWQFLATLQQAISTPQGLAYAQLKSVVEHLSHSLLALGCPMGEWNPRVTMLLKHANWQEYLHGEVSNQLAAVKLEKADCHTTAASLRGTAEQLRAVAVASSERQNSLSARAIKIHTELARAEADLKEAERLKIQAAEEVDLAEGQLASVDEKLWQLEATESRLQEMV